MSVDELSVGRATLWIRTLDRYTRAGLPECVVSSVLGPPQETAQGRTQNIQPNPRIETKFPYTTGNRTRTAELEVRNSTDHGTATDLFHFSLEKPIQVLFAERLPTVY